MTNTLNPKVPYLVVRHNPTTHGLNETRHIADYQTALLIAKKIVAAEYKKQSIPLERKITKKQLKKLGLTGNEVYIKELSVKDEMKLERKDGILRMWLIPNTDTAIYISLGENAEMPVIPGGMQ